MSRRDLNNTGRYISRPRSLGLLSPVLNSQSSHSLYSNGSRSYDHGLRGYEQYSYNPYANNYNSSLYRNSSPYNNVSSTPDSMYGSSYGNKFSSYAGKKRVPSHSTLSSLNLMTGYKGLNKPEKQTYQYNPYTPSISKDYGAPIKPERKSRQSSRSSSFNKPRSRSIGSSHDSMGSRSTSLSSLPFDTSEGYISGSARESLSKEENGEIDYKALWESSQIEVKRLNDVILGNEKELIEAKNAVEKYTNLVVSENEKREKRERRAMERKLSEMEEELKQLQKLKAENERLKAENRALTRVVSKLTNSAGK